MVVTVITAEFAGIDHVQRAASRVWTVKVFAGTGLAVVTV
jgi:hypothetical protein